MLLPLQNTSVVAIIDDRYAHLLQYRWYLDSSGYVRRYTRVGTRKITIGLHRDVLGLVYGDGKIGDHRDGNPLNNRLSNLRITNTAGNGQNKPSYKSTSSRYRGVCWNKRQAKWQATVGLAGQKYYLGLFDSEDDAGRVAETFRQKRLPMNGNRTPTATAARVAPKQTVSANGAKDKCPNGHDYDGANTYERPDGGRGCKECRRDATRRWRTTNRNEGVLR